MLTYVDAIKNHKAKLLSNFVGELWGMLWFRIDDISLNSDITKVNAIIEMLLNLKLKDHTVNIIAAISPCVTNCSQEKHGRDQEINPALLDAMSDRTIFFKPDRCGVPSIVQHPKVKMGSHGLYHVDHRLLNKDEQRLSIITSCALTHSDIFVPPYNKWNTDTESVCKEQGITLVKFEDGWLGLEHNKFELDKCKKWYLHPWRWESAEDIKNKILCES